MLVGTVGVGHHPAARLNVGHTVTHQRRADGNREVGVPGEVEVAQDAAIHTATRLLHLLDQLHRTHLWRARECAGREACGDRVQCAAALAEQTGHRGHQVHDVAVTLDVAVVLDTDAARRADPAEVVAAQVDQHQMLGPLLVVGEQLLFQQLIFFLGLPPPPGTGDRMGRRTPFRDGDEGFGAGSDDRKVRRANAIRYMQQVHVGAGVGHPQNPVDLERVDVGVHFEALRGHHLKSLAGGDLLDEVVDDLAVLLDRALRPERRLGPAERRDRGRQRLTQRLGHDVQTGDGVVVGLVDSLVGAVPVHGVGDQRDGALVVVDSGHVGGEQHQHVRQPEVVDGQLGQAFQAPHHVVGEEPDQSARQRRQPRDRRRGKQLQGCPQRIERVTAGGRVLRHCPQPDRLAVAHGQRRGRSSPDERPARPRPAVFRGLQQEGAGAIGGELAVCG